MKLFLKVSIALIIASFLFVSCVSTNPIIILKKGQDPCSLKLKGNINKKEITRTRGFNVVTWKCGSGVSEISGIFHKDGDNVFLIDPQKKPNNSDWFAITRFPNKHLIEEYGIKWIDSQNNNCTKDPTIKVEPKDE